MTTLIEMLTDLINTTGTDPTDLADALFDRIIQAAEVSGLTPSERREMYEELARTVSENSDTAPPDEELSHA